MGIEVVDRPQWIVSRQSLAGVPAFADDRVRRLDGAKGGLSR
jgi:hypothetical protein